MTHKFKLFLVGDREIVTDIYILTLNLHCNYAFLRIYANALFDNYLEGNLVSSKFTRINCENLFLDANTIVEDGKEIQQYVEYYCQRDNYVQLLNSLISGLESCKFSKFYSISPFLPKNLYPYYESYYKSNEGKFDKLEVFLPMKLQ